LKNTQIITKAKATRCDFFMRMQRKFVELHEPEIAPCSHHLINTSNFSKYGFVFPLKYLGQENLCKGWLRSMKCLKIITCSTKMCWVQYFRRM